MKERKIYLAGAINGLTFSQASEWRNEVSFLARARKLTTIDPMDSKEFSKIDYNTPIDDSEFKSVTSKQVVTKDLEEVSSCDIFLINLSHLSSKKMIGSLLEMGYAFSLGKPIISLYLPSTHKDHPFLKEMISKSFDDIESLIDFIYYFA